MPWTYDSYVPIVFTGLDVPAQRVYRLVHTVDIAPTLAAYIGSKPPSGATGRPLTEVVGSALKN